MTELGGIYEGFHTTRQQSIALIEIQMDLTYFEHPPLMVILILSQDCRSVFFQLNFVVVIFFFWA